MRRLCVLLVALSPASFAWAQVDFSGAWDHPGLFGHAGGLYTEFVGLINIAL